MISGKKATKQDYTLYTGLVDLELLIANPDEEQLKKLLRTDNVKPPVYHGVKDGVAYNNMKIYCRGTYTYENGDNDTFIVAMQFWLKDNEIVYSKDVDENNPDLGKKVCLINNHGRIRRGAGRNGELASSTFTAPGFRVAKEGEDRLYNMLTKWLNFDTKSEDAEIVLDNYDALLKQNNTSEINQIIQEFNENRVRALVGVRKNRWMTIHDKEFLYEGEVPSDIIDGANKTLSWFTRTVLNTDAQGNPSQFGSPFDADFQGSYILQPYKPTLSSNLSGLVTSAPSSSITTSPSATPFGGGSSSTSTKSVSPFG